jgi:hypothetical protein
MAFRTGRTLKELFESNDLVNFDGFLVLPDALPVLLSSSFRPFQERLRKPALTANDVAAACKESVSN